MLSSAVITRSWPSLNIWRYRAPTDDGEVYTNKHSFTPNDIDIGRDPNLILDCHARATKNSRSLRDQKTSTQPARWTRVRDVREIVSAVDSKSGIEVSPEQLAILVMQFIAGCISALDGSVDAEALQGWENEANSPQTLSKQAFAQVSPGKGSKRGATEKERKAWNPYRRKTKRIISVKKMKVRPDKHGSTPTSTCNADAHSPERSSARHPRTE
ncbi:hypothetical protein B0H14DRAFT_3787667 [Mycena olivaceomarginata]|nr:hypothetical protein B0H14DRAFT_3787667 [Mycena olivaceomarginata]